MELHTTRFGTIEIDEDRVITIPEGLYGFPDKKRFALLQPSDDPCFFWLQCTHDPELAFVVTDPSYFIKDWKTPTDLPPELDGSEPSDQQVLVIVNKHGGELTGNTQGPLIIDTKHKIGAQVVLPDRKFTTRHHLMRVANQR